MSTFQRQILSRFLYHLKENQVETHAICIYHDGKQILNQAYAPFDTNVLHPLYSVTKSFTSLAFGFLQQEQHLDVNTTWISYFPEYESYATKEFKTVTLKSLLTMTLGQDSETILYPNTDWIPSIISKPIVYQPGSKFFYNSTCSYLISRLIEKLIKQKLSDYLNEKLFQPLDIQEYEWEEDQQGHCIGGFGLHLKTEDLAKVGYCILNKGMYEGKQILPLDYLEEATQKQVDNASEYPVNRSENRQGYGYQFWMCSRDGFRCSGLHGQLCYINPKEHLVIAMSSCTTGSQAILDCLFKAYNETTIVEPYTDFNIPKITGLPTSKYLKEYLGRYTALENPAGITSMELKQEGSEVTLEIQKANKTYTIEATYNDWYQQENVLLDFSKLYWQDAMKPLEEIHQYPMYANMAWLTPTTLSIQTRALNSSSAHHFNIHLDGQKGLRLEYSVSGLYTAFATFEVIFKPTK